MMDNTALKVVARFQTALERQNPLMARLMSRQQAVKYLYKIIGRTPEGFFRDQSWQPITQIFRDFRNNGIEYEITKADYTHDHEGRPNAKVWKFEVSFTNKSGKTQIVYGTITAAGAGSTQDVLDRYDVTVVLG
jgi:glutamyl-tRNA reductase